jgi:hypothetical protein
MQERTAFRLAAHDNGYWMVLNDCKEPVETGWSKKRPSRDEILLWNRSTYLSTGMKIDGDLAAIDTDIREAPLRDALIDALDERYPDLFVRGLVRHAGEVKQAWFVRTIKPFQKIASRKWTRGDPNDPKAETQHVECFGSRKTRQFGVDGPHSRNPRTGEILRVYQFVDGASPATIPRTALPVLPKEAFTAACNLFEEIAQAAGLSIVKTKGQSGEGKRVVFDLTDDMVFENECGAYRGLEELTDAYIAAKHDGRELRVTSSFLGHDTNPTKCVVGWLKCGCCVFIHDFETGLTHKPARRAPPDMAKFFELLNRRVK